MKTRLILSALAILALAAFGSPVLAQTDGFGFGVGGFLDENGDGFNDLAPDADGDGIPNGVDPDYVPPLDGTGYQLGDCNRAEGEDGFVYSLGYKWKNFFGGTTGFGPGDGTGNGGTGPGDGTGFGPGDGTCTPQMDGNGSGGRN